MANPSPSLGDGLASLAPSQFAAFVAALWEARGRSVSRDGRLLTVRQGGSGPPTRLVAVAADDDRPIPDDADVVVHANDAPPESAPTGARLVGPDDVVNLVRYAIGQRDSERLVRDHLGDSFVPAPPGSSDAGGPTAAGTDRPAPAMDVADGGDVTDPRRPSRGGGESAGQARNAPDADGTAQETSRANGARRGPRRREVLLGAGAFLAGVGGTIALGLGPFGGSGEEDSRASRSVASAAPDPFTVEGLTADGVGSPRTLAAGHVRNLDDTAFTIESHKTVHAADGGLLSSLALETQVTADRRFHVRVGAQGPAGEPLFDRLPARAALWTDGETYLRRLTADGEPQVEEYQQGFTIDDWYLWSSLVPFDGPPTSAFDFYREFFEAVPVVVHAGARDDPYTLTATDRTLDPAPLLFDTVDTGDAITDLAVTSVVTDEGLVRSHRLAYAGLLRDAPVDVQWNIAYRDVGETTVERPAWVETFLE
jgi:hypothetical protein